MYFTVWRDPTTGEEAFKVLLPKGWTAKDQIQRPYFAPDISFRARDPNGTMAVFFARRDYPLYLEPYAPGSADCLYPHSVPACTEGNWYQPLPAYPAYRVYIYHYLSASSYIRTILLPRIRSSYPDAFIMALNERPDFLQEFVSPFEVDEASGADALIAYTDNGTAYRMGIVADTGRVTSVLGSTSVWWGEFAGALAPEADFGKGADVTRDYSAIVSTVRFDPGWMRREIRNSAQRSDPIKSDFGRLTWMDLQMFMQLTSSPPRVNRAWSNALGVDWAGKDPKGGEVYTVPHHPGLSHFWINDARTIVATAVDTAPGTDFREMRGVTVCIGSGPYCPSPGPMEVPPSAGLDHGL